jgi:hypothetical protein
MVISPALQRWVGATSNPSGVPSGRRETRQDAGLNEINHLNPLRRVVSCQFVISVKLVLCAIDPPVAVTVTVEVTGGGSDTVPAELQPPSRPIPATLSASSRSIGKRRRFFHPMKQNAAAKADAGISGLELRRKAAEEAAVVTVSVV